MLPPPRAASGRRGGGGGLRLGRVRKVAPEAMREAGEARLGGRGWCCWQERPWAEPVPWGAGRRARLRAEVGGCSAASFILPFQPMFAWSFAPSSPGQAERGELAAPEAELWAGRMAPRWGAPSPEGSGRAPGSSTSAHQKTSGSSPMGVLRAAHFPKQRDFVGDFRRSLLVCTFSRRTEKLVLFIPPHFNLSLGGFFGPLWPKVKRKLQMASSKSLDT